ncbi:MAG TPA: 4Fe-4S binding protein [Spirochaetota bacterium]|nr:4Fe-4S binding protein [Spirochaetota bacterium]HOF13552.1 4Fe-4S binding protein [Spirochaetota bacterium]HOM87191.1 4Fe-4S binding protein [Spirochaetota bacterium]HOR92497.1 4Fe-4S binding protein [Spirochaetota bacterium]HPD04596.1 4Fe-4S binding protein [Spirochaetota bacterium]
MGHIVIDSNRCKGCYFCITYCPKQILVISKNHNIQGYFPAELADDKKEHCTACKICALMCPDTAIEVFK